VKAMGCYIREPSETHTRAEWSSLLCPRDFCFPPKPNIHPEANETTFTNISKLIATATSDVS
jgi:hypothetical protein